MAIDFAVSAKEPAERRTLLLDKMDTAALSSSCEELLPYG
jgi:hypothetical protein